MSELQREFWRGFQQHLRTNSTVLGVTKAADNYMNFSTGRDGVMITARFAPTEFRVAVEITINETPGDGKPLFNAIRTAREQDATRVLQGNVTWTEAPDRPEGHVLVKTGITPELRSEWPEKYEWLRVQAETLHSWVTELATRTRA
jgi:hypothetical protein